MKKLTIIIPFYNSKEYILDAINSILNQATSDIEILLIDDGSTDESHFIIESNFNNEINNKEIILIKQNNSGVSAARNKGISLSTGKYVTFFDSDDIALPGYIEYIINSIDKFNTDIIEFGFKQFNNSSTIEEEKEQYSHYNFGKLSAKNHLNEIYSKSIWYPCIRVFKSEIIKRNTFPIGVRFCEDMMLLSKIYTQIETIYHIEKTLYGYRTNQNGATLNIKKDYLENIYLFFKEHEKSNDKHIEYLRINIHYIIYRCSTELYEKYYNKKTIRDDSLSLFYKYYLDSSIPLRIKLILLSPYFYDKFKTIKSLISRNK